MTQELMIGHYYAPDGSPIGTMEYLRLMSSRRSDENDSWWRRKTNVGEAEVSTVWLGINHNWGDGPPLIWETMIFGGEYNEYQWRWASQADALTGHEHIVAMLRKGEQP